MRSLIVALFAMAMIVGCSDEPTSPSDTNTNSKNSFNVTGSGYSNASFKGYNADTASLAQETGGPAAQIAFTGLGSKEGEVFSIGLRTSDVKKQKYTINGTSVTLSVVIINGSTSKTFLAATGEIEIKSWDAVGGRAAGTFNGTAGAIDGSGTITITDGKFDAKRI